VNLSIRQKLYLCAGLSFVGIFAMAMLNIYIARQSGSALSNIYEQVLVPSDALRDMSDSLRDIELGMVEVLSGHGSPEEARTSLIERRRQIRDAWKEFRHTQSGIAVSREELLASRLIEEQLALAQTLFDDLETAYSLPVASNAVLPIESRMHALRGSIAQPLDRLADIELEEARGISADGTNLSKDTIVLSILAVSLSIPCLGVFVFWMIAHLDRNISAINRALARVAHGELDVKIGVVSKDELGTMADSLSRTLEIIRTGHESLVALQSRDELILNALHEGLFGEDKQGHIVFVNPAMEKMLGWEADKMMGCRSREMFELSQVADEEVTSRAHLSTDDMEDGHCFRRKDGSIFPVECTRIRVEDDDASLGAVVVFRDISERKRARDELLRGYAELKELNLQLEQTQGQLLQSEKMASLGQLAAGVAHEINNPVGFIKSNLGSLDVQVTGLLGVIDAYEQATFALCASPSVLEDISSARDAADLSYVRDDIGTLIRETAEGASRVQAIVRDLKEFSHPDNAEPHLTDLHKGLDSTLNIVWNEIKYKATVIKEYGDLPQVECVPAQINQVFMNLLVNAAQAIDTHGTITLRTGSDGGSVWVEVADSGQGIAPAHLPRIFDPFFTTKPVGQGTGLGLSLAYGIVTKHGGKIDVESEVGKGTVFRIRLPLVRHAISRAEPAHM
jgi:PAS domain S-box-containing protein